MSDPTNDTLTAEAPEVIPGEIPNEPTDNADIPSETTVKQFVDSGFPIDGPASLTQIPSSRI
jgi:hypothetical protein